MTDDIEKMIAYLTEFYESAGFCDFYNNVLINMSEEEICSLYKETYNCAGINCCFKALFDI